MVVVVDTPPGRELPKTSSVWLGEREGLSAHEGAIVSLIVLGLSNQEIAGALANRTQAISWGILHGLRLTAPAARLNEGGQQ